MTDASVRQRSLSPTLKLHDKRKQALESMAKMASMGLHVFHPDWQTVQSGVMPRGRQYSTSFKTVSLKLMGSIEALSISVQTCTKVQDVKDALGGALSIPPDSIEFLEKRGCTTRKQRPCEEIGSNVTVKGVRSFKEELHEWPHPVGIIGCGYAGLKTAMAYAKSGNHNFVNFDRNDKVGGYCWTTAANQHSKLQTEFGAFHCWWGQDFVTDACTYPSGWESWPKKAEVLKHFQFAAEQYGLLPNLQLNSNVAKMDIVGDKDALDHHYKLTVTQVGGGNSREINVSVLYSFPGSMTRNRIINYLGEDIFGGLIAYGMNDDCPYHELPGRNIAILGNGAFAVENARTAVEHAAHKVFLLTRRKNLASPRVPCWFVHQGPAPTPCKMVLDMFKPMYELANFGDPWKYWSVHASNDKSRANIIQNSRFGIGDVTFLMVIYGKLEYVEDTLKRLTHRTLHLSSGRTIQDISIILKSLGLLGDFEFDRLHKMEKLIGMFCDGDWRRPVSIDATGLNAANFTTFSAGIGMAGLVRGLKYLHDHPKEYDKAVGAGFLKQLPINKADVDLDKPAYVVDVKHTMSASIIMESLIPKISLFSSTDSEYKYRMIHTAHPIDRFLQECIEDWDKYQDLFRKQGFDHEYVPYPYTKAVIEDFCKEYGRLTGIMINVDGPPKDSPELKVIEPGALGEPPAWAQDLGHLQNMEKQLLKDKSWWSQASNIKEDLFLRSDYGLDRTKFNSHHPLR